MDTLWLAGGFIVTAENATIYEPIMEKHVY